MECLEMPLCPTHEKLCPGTERWDKTTGTEGIESEPYVPHPRHCKTLCPGTERWDTTTGTEGSGQNVSVPLKHKELSLVAEKDKTEREGEL